MLASKECRLFIFFWIFLGYTKVTFAQTVIGMGTESPNPNAVLELVSESFDQGFLVPRFTTIQRNSLSFTTKLSSAENGLLIFDSDEGAFYYWYDGKWQQGIGESTLQDTGTVWYTGSTIPDDNEGNNGDFYIHTLSGDIYRKQSGIFSVIGNILPQKSQYTGGTGISIDADNKINNTGDLDNSNEIQELQLIGDELKITKGTSSVNLADYKNDDTNELIQGVSLTGETLRISDSGGNYDVDLSSLKENLLDNDPVNEIQDLTLSSNELSLTNNPSATSIDLSTYLDNTDNQTLSFTGTNLNISGGNGVDLSSLQDGTGSDDQNLGSSKSGNEVTVTIEDGSSTTFSVADDDNSTTNEIQDLTLSSNELSITNNPSATSIDLSPYLDNTDNQTLSFTGTNLNISGGNGVDLSSLHDGTGSDDQNLGSSKSGNDVTVTIEDGSSTTFSIADDDNSTTNEIQDLTLSSNELSITNNPSATSIDLSTYLDNTDNQTLSFTGTNLNISGGNGVDLSSLQDGTGSDDQNLGSSKSGNDVTVTIEDGSSTTFSVADDDNSTTNETIDGVSLEAGNTLRITEAGTNHDVDLSSFQKTDLSSGKLWVGNTSNVAAPVTISGNFTLASDGTLTLKVGAVTTAHIIDNAITTAKIANGAVNKDKINADIAGSGLGQNANGSLEINAGGGLQIASDQLALTNSGNGEILIGDGSNVNAQTVSGDVSLANDGTANVTGLQGRAVSSASPTSGHVLTWNGSAWEGQASGSAGSGSAWYSGNSVPGVGNPASAVDGDYYYHDITETIYRKVSGAWIEQGKWARPSGSVIQGPTSISEISTPTIYIGAGSPTNGSSNNGNPGDLYYDTSSNKLYIKKNSTLWIPM